VVRVPLWEKGFLGIEWAIAPEVAGRLASVWKKFLTEARRTRRKNQLYELSSQPDDRDCFSLRTLRLCERWFFLPLNGLSPRSAGQPASVWKKFLTEAQGPQRKKKLWRNNFAAPCPSVCFSLRTLRLCERRFFLALNGLSPRSASQPASVWKKFLAEAQRTQRRNKTVRSSFPAPCPPLFSPWSLCLCERKVFCS